MKTGSAFFPLAVFDLSPTVAFTLSIFYSKPKQNPLCCHCKGRCIPALQTLTQAQAAARCCREVTVLCYSHRDFALGLIGSSSCPEVSSRRAQDFSVNGPGFCLPSESCLTPISKSWNAKTEKVCYENFRRAGESLVPASAVRCSCAWPGQRNSWHSWDL